MGQREPACVCCGACCATYRVVFAAEELDTAGGTVPADLVECADGRKAFMRGTAGLAPRCVALQGVIGERVACAIYERRPTPCREFAPEAAAGRGDAMCGDARRRHGLLPLEGSYDSFVLG